MELREEGEGFVSESLAEVMQNDIDTLDLSGAEEEGKTLLNTYHQADCAFAVSDGEAECNCLPIQVDVADIRRIGAEKAAVMIESYLMHDERQPEYLNLTPEES